MPREIVARGLILGLRHAPCAHICRYCLVSETRKGSALPFSRFERLVHRFFDWKASSGNDFDIRTFVGPSLDYDIDTLKGVARLRARKNLPFEILNLGGLRLRDAAGRHCAQYGHRAEGCPARCFHVCFRHRDFLELSPS